MLNIFLYCHQFSLYCGFKSLNMQPEHVISVCQLSNFSEIAFSLWLSVVCNNIPLLYSERQHKAGPNEQIQGQHHRHESHRQQSPAEHAAPTQHLHQPTQASLQQYPWWVTLFNRSAPFTENRAHNISISPRVFPVPAAQKALYFYIQCRCCGCLLKACALDLVLPLFLLFSDPFLLWKTCKLHYNSNTKLDKK